MCRNLKTSNMNKTKQIKYLLLLERKPKQFAVSIFFLGIESCFTLNVFRMILDYYIATLHCYLLHSHLLQGGSEFSHTDLSKYERFKISPLKVSFEIIRLNWKVSYTETCAVFTLNVCSLCSKSNKFGLVICWEAVLTCYSIRTGTLPYRKATVMKSQIYLINLSRKDFGIVCCIKF